jgi:hypothetical protein
VSDHGSRNLRPLAAITSALLLGCGVKAPPRPPLPERPTAAPSATPTAPAGANVKKKTAKPTSDADSR